MLLQTRWAALVLGAAGLAFGGLTGCQTWVAGMTLPSGHYLDHPPQYFPQSPAFPLSKELANQEAINQAPAPGAGSILPVPPAVPGVLPPG